VKCVEVHIWCICESIRTSGIASFFEAWGEQQQWLFLNGITDLKEITIIHWIPLHLYQWWAKKIFFFIFTTFIMLPLGLCCQGQPHHLLPGAATPLAPHYLIPLILTNISHTGSVETAKRFCIGKKHRCAVFPLNLLYTPYSALCTVACVLDIYILFTLLIQASVQYGRGVFLSGLM
jgi:hypothetical protein